MNVLAGLTTSAFAFVLMMVMTTFLLGKEFALALLYSSVAAITMFFTFGYLARRISADINGATPEKAAAIIAAKFKIVQTALPAGGLRLTGGANFFWAPVDVTPTANGVSLRGPGNIVSFMKAQLEKT